nr:hypothetical protein [Ktedonobacter sp. SOSP1-85]
MPKGKMALNGTPPYIELVRVGKMIRAMIGSSQALDDGLTCLNVFVTNMDLFSSISTCALDRRIIAQ